MTLVDAKQRLGEGGAAKRWDPAILGYGYGSIPINTIFRGMNIHLPAILMFTRCQGFGPSPYDG